MARSIPNARASVAPSPMLLFPGLMEWSDCPSLRALRDHSFIVGSQRAQRTIWPLRPPLLHINLWPLTICPLIANPLAFFQFLNAHAIDEEPPSCALSRRRASGHPNQDAEKACQRRSHLARILNIAKRLCLRCFSRLRPCWTDFLSILWFGAWQWCRNEFCHTLLKNQLFSSD